MSKSNYKIINNKIMSENTEKISKRKTLLLIIKNYIFVFLWVTYFAYYFSPKYSWFIKNIKETIKYWEIILQYSNAVMAFLTIIWLIGFINRLLEIILTKIASKTDNDIDNIFVDYLINFIKTNKYFIWLYVFFQFLDIPNNYEKYINKFFYIIFLVIFIYYLTSFLNVTFEKFLLKKTRFRSLNKNLLSFIKKILIISTWIIWVITILSNLGYDVTALITWAWIWGLAIALAAQKTLSNVFWAITVLLTKPFKIWDFVKIDGQVWEIKEMWISHLTMIDKEWYYVLIPNEKLISSNLENLSKRETRRNDFVIWLVYNTTLLDLKKAISIIEDILQNYIKNHTIESYRVGFDNFWDFSLNIKATYFSLLNDTYLEFVKQKEEINLKIKQAFEKEKINMAFPTQEIILKK